MFFGFPQEGERLCVVAGQGGCDAGDGPKRGQALLAGELQLGAQAAKRLGGIRFRQSKEVPPRAPTQCDGNLHR